jgi:mRNA-degrading endonuclease YafQ of YafQ-DinJ toxin-antitoxin module
MEVLFSDALIKSIRKYSSIKKAIQNKVDMIVSNPIGMGEPLKGTFRGYYSCPVKKNFLLIYLYCKICRKKGDNTIVLCDDCITCTDETISFVELGPHDKAYRK